MRGEWSISSINEVKSKAHNEWKEKNWKEVLFYFYKYLKWKKQNLKKIIIETSLESEIKNKWKCFSTD